MDVVREYVYFTCIVSFIFGLEGVTSSRDLALHKLATQSTTLDTFDAGRAVDGTPGRDVSDGHCTYTGNGQSQAWWKVDLGQVYGIQMINITYRHDYTYRLSGYYLYVTNHTDMTHRDGSINVSLGHLCYHDNGTRYPSYIQSHNCTVSGRYVVFYNKRPAESVPTHHDSRYLYSEAYIELCEVQVFHGCPVGQFGDDCGFTCHCAEGDCDSDTGICDARRCQTGWQGPSCYVPSSDLAYHKIATESSVKDEYPSDAQKAVDGLPGKDSCSHTYPNAYREAWWMVDLGQEHTINTIHIVFTQNHTYIIAGYSLYVSSAPIAQDVTGNLNHAYVCYRDNTTTSDAPPMYRQSHQCSVTGRYVIVYNTRSSTLQYSDSHYSPEDAIVELCDVQVLMCSRNTFGPNCSKICHCKSNGCNPITGECHVPGCQLGWTGRSCSIQGCPVGYFGTNFANECHCKTGGCNMVNGTCTTRGCTDGWRGDACNQECTNQTFGQDCNKTCHCASPGCDRRNGTCTKPGCKEGWFGDTCSTECTNYTFGQNCNKTCHCVNSGCDRRSGICTKPGCTEGWSGDTCTNECMNHTFGRDCNGTCHCASLGCDKRNGMCNMPGCQRGWTGDTCSQECVNHTFGRDCNMSCHCANSDCDGKSGICKVPGCIEGWSGVTCSQECVNHTFCRNCNQTCHCINSDCDGRSGICKVPGCTEGWYGVKCSQECVGNTFGRDCNQTCHCANSDCDGRNGICTIPGCMEGWTGNTCSHDCLAGRFGKGCLQECHCKVKACDNVDGTCNALGCKDGWRGKSCDHTCDFNHFGPDCIHKCHCNISGCSKIDGICEIPGCEDGWTGASCSKVAVQERILIKANHSLIEEVSTSQYTTGYAVLGTFLFISILFNVGFIVHCLRMRFRDSRNPKTSHELQTYHISDFGDNYEGLDSSQIDSTRNVYDTIAK